MHSAKKKKKTEKSQQIQHKTPVFPKVEESQQNSAEATRMNTHKRPWFFFLKTCIETMFALAK